ncbi:META domain-containing protein [Flammeovirgaceae bacterium KN852]|uniref:META domain-containing protein n=2 Tax=Marinigracilibium pacificum TaxID=2729599 RepID=A0A848IY83_9BACT|nr:META domain-containing protein [Marinigracilibium pacificum]NMM48245.1 META domain-containing protein [Marinigracilibium pacificum]
MKYTWRLNKIHMSEVNDASSFERIPNISFEKDGWFHGNTGCNIFKGKYKSEGNNLVFELLPITKKECPGRGENDLILSLGKTTNYRIENDLLILSNKEGDLLTYTTGK